jgi:ABC-type glycerol-3-phosphate transport system permease component
MLIPNPRELDEAAIVDDASPLRIFFFIILPLLRPPIVTVVVTSSVTIFNDFVGPLYFLPGVKNVTAPLTLFSFISQYRVHILPEAARFGGEEWRGEGVTPPQYCAGRIRNYRLSLTVPGTRASTP